MKRNLDSADDNGTIPETIIAAGAVAAMAGLAATQASPGAALEQRAAWHRPMHLDVVALCGAIAMMAWTVLTFLRLARRRTLCATHPATAAAAERGAERDPLRAARVRRRFDIETESAFAGPAPASLFVLDIDGFRALSRAHGTLAAEALLRVFGERLAALAPVGAIVTWLTGDEFAVLLPGADDTAACTAASILVAGLCGPLVVGNHTMTVSVSVGVAMAPAHGNSAAGWLQAARLAVGQAKMAGGWDWRMFDPSIGQALQSRIDLRSALRSGLQNAEFIPYYQPIIRLDTGEIAGLEVLARWNHPERGLLAPHEFIDLMEEQRLCAALSLGLLHQVVADARHWPQSWTFAFNASAGQLRELLHFVREPLNPPQGALDPRRIELEVTETVLIEDMELARRVVQAMHRAGIKVVLDDFGTGYANLLHLRELPFDRIKIDRSFVRDMLVSARTDACLRAMLGLARNLGATVVAEGVETAAAEQRLRDMGCDYAQGFYYSPPVPAAGVALLARRAERNRQAA